MTYFKNTPVNIENNSKLREPQIEAYLSIREFFEDDENKEALVVLPTGTGKSGLISIAPFGVADKRVLVITPGIVTKNSVLKTLHPLDGNFWLQYDIIFNAENIPAIEEYTPDMLDSSLEKLDIVVTNVHQLNENNARSLLNRVEKDFFDFIIVDEAHHSVADSWKKIITYFNDAKVLHVTGTPYRGDHQELPGKEIHNTPLSEVMALKYVKGLRKKNINSKDLSFTIPEAAEPLTKEQVLLFKESEWLQRSVALSENCSKEVIEETINQLREIKKVSTKVPHKILAVACSISHAEDLKKWYEEMSMRTEIVHSEMNRDTLDNVFQRIENHQCEVVVSVNMLMEGYDHKYLTVLGLFRPYRSKNAFAQVVGRVLRAIPENEIISFDIDNNAVLVFHEEIGLNEMWEDFASEVQKSKNIPVKEFPITDREYTKRKIIYGEVFSKEHFISDEESYLKEVDFNQLFEAAKEKIKLEKAERRIQLEKLNIPEDQIKAMLEGLEKQITREKSDEIDEILISKRPEEARRKTREYLYKNAHETAENLLTEFNLDPKGNDLVPIFSKLIYNIKASDSNDGIIVRYINSKLSRKFGPVKGREPEALLASKKYAQEYLIPELRRLLEDVNK
ncbi:DEAD/DEAH box helicase family protein [Vagococcus fluvialis]|uniref:DEAD/DEAH box helicase n=1 Tax=Vagococcus fluvialis TaxID=2738 RepID=UPI001A8D8850|nr:DEAD/DEAH box helicase family protein [Vagococcus fluvialis]MBO0427817.1 DEAD/DEAH box helicase family protein [Vagococcus fluvialis]